MTGMRWLSSSYTLRLNRRHKLFGNVFSGRYKALLVDGSGDGYLKTVCDYVHLNPVRAKLLGTEDRLAAYPWSSMVWHLAARQHRPAWMRTDRLLGAHGIKGDTAAGRDELERRMEARRRAESDEEEWKALRRGWCLGREEFKKEMIERMETRLGEHHSGELKRESAEAKAERIIREELQRLGWKSADLTRRLKSDPGKLEIATRVRNETTLPVKWIAHRLHMGSWKSATTRLHVWKKQHASITNVNMS